MSCSAPFFCPSIQKGQIIGMISYFSGDLIKIQHQKHFCRCLLLFSENTEKTGRAHPLERCQHNAKKEWQKGFFINTKCFYACGASLGNNKPEETIIWTEPKFDWCIYKYINIQSFDSPISSMSLSVITIDRWQEKNMKINVEKSDLDHNVN